MKQLTHDEQVKKALAERILYAELFHDETVEVKVDLLKKIQEMIDGEAIPVLLKKANSMIHLWKCKDCTGQICGNDTFCPSCGKHINWKKEEWE